MKSELKIDKNGNRIWFNEKGKIHRDNGPAVEGSNGYKSWHKNENGKLHRLDGPAVECANGYKEYWIDGKEYTEEDFHKKLKELNEI